MITEIDDKLIWIRDDLAVRGISDLEELLAARIITLEEFEEYYDAYFWSEDEDDY